MRKLAVGLLVGVATSSIVVTATLIASGFSLKTSEDEDIDSVSLAVERWEGKKIPLVTSSEIKKKHKGIKCLEEIKKGEVWGDKLKKKAKPSFTVDSNSQDLKGCLIVEYYKQKNKENKWRGSFKLIWSVSSNNKNLILAFNADTWDGKLILDSSIYIVGSSGNINYQKENNSKNITKKMS